MLKKRGEVKSATGAAALVLLIGVFIALYLVLIPKSDRDQILNQTSRDDVRNRILEEQNILLQAQPGEIIADADGIIKHEILPIMLFIKDEPNIQALASNLKVERGLFNKKEHTLTFSIQDLEDLKQSALFFYVRKAKGSLRITLNDNSVYEQEIRPNKLERVILPKEKLISGENKLKLDVDVGIFTQNAYDLESIEIRNNYQVQNTQEERTVNLETPLKDAKLSYSLFCKSSDKTTTMQIFVNNKEQFSGIIPCTSVQTLDIDTETLNDGTNSIVFEIDRGEYQISNIVLSTKSEQAKGWNSRFYISSSEYDMIKAESAEVTLRMDLSGRKKKNAEIRINDKRITLDTEDSAFETFITSSIKKGTNTVEIIPTQNFRVDELTINVNG